MPLDHYVTLGRSGLRVSPFCLGAMTFGEEWGWGASVKDSQAILDRFIDQGGNFIDTANIYTNGHSEQIIGDHIGRHPARRNRAVIATKFFGGMFEGDPNGGGANRKSIMAACEHSLRRLQTDYIDLYWMHAWDWTTPIDETLRAMDDLVHAGKVRYIGFSDTPAWKTAQAQTMAEFRGWSPLIALQVEYSLLERTVEGELLPMARELGLGVTPWSPLKWGVLTGKYTRDNHGQIEAGRADAIAAMLTDATYDLLDVLGRVAGDLGSTPARVALAWVRGRRGVTSTIIGARTLAQLDENLSALELELGDEHLEELNAASKPRLNFPADFLERVPGFAYGGTTIEGVTGPWLPHMPSDEERY